MTQPAPTAPVRQDVQTATELVAERLGETEDTPIATIRLLIEFWGAAFVLRYVERAEAVQQGGGLHTKEGDPRTLGGVFFYLLKHDLASVHDPRIAELWPSVWRRHGRSLVRALTALARKSQRPVQTDRGPSPQGPRVEASATAARKVTPPRAEPKAARKTSSRAKSGTTPTSATTAKKAAAAPSVTPAKPARPRAADAPGQAREASNTPKQRRPRVSPSAPVAEVIVRRPRPASAG